MTQTTGRRTAVALTPMRQAISRRMTASNRDVPQFSISTMVDVESGLLALEALNAGSERSRVTLTSLLVVAAAAALSEHPNVNACWEAGDLYLHGDVNVGVAIAVDSGLLAPALTRVSELSLLETAEALRDLVARTRASRLRAPELTAATFTLTNLGMFDVASFTPIVMPPQVAILATSSVAHRPVFERGEWRAARSLTATLTCDHRALDGADGARFLQTFKRAVGETSQAAADLARAA